MVEATLCFVNLGAGCLVYSPKLLDPMRQSTERLIPLRTRVDSILTSCMLYTATDTPFIPGGCVLCTLYKTCVMPGAALVYSRTFGASIVASAILT
ncbi:hypothetical protein E4T47_08200 [Aureobasidium subglaciale]|nr:hypothetical protein E4T47_08200 [Aureobasidium subglaciale]